MCDALPSHDGESDEAIKKMDARRPWLSGFFPNAEFVSVSQLEWPACARPSQFRASRTAALVPYVEINVKTPVPRASAGAVMAAAWPGHRLSELAQQCSAYESTWVRATEREPSVKVATYIMLAQFIE